MHSKDSHWRGMAVMNGDFLLLGAAWVFSLYALSDFSLQEVFHSIDWSSSSTYMMILLFVAFGLALVRFFLHYAISARLRERCRTRALAGDGGAMPVASSQPEMSLEATADALHHEPLTLRWKNGSVITASADGLLWRRPKQRDVLLGWGEACLLEL